MATRRKQPKRPKSAKARAKARSAAAKKGWATRRFLENPLPFIFKAKVPDGIQPFDLFEGLVDATVKEIEKRGKVRTFGQARMVALKGASRLQGRFSKDHKVLEALVSNLDPRWLDYLELCEEAGLDLEEARDYWFSPEV